MSTSWSRSLAQTTASVVIDTATLANERELTLVAAAVAYYALAAALPLVVLVFIGATIVGADQFVEQAIAAAEPFLSEAGVSTLESVLQNQDGRTGVGLFGFLAVLWGSLKLFRGLSKGVGELYSETHENSLLDQFYDGILLLVLVLTVFLLFVGFETIVSSMSMVAVGSVWSAIGFTIFLMAILSAVYAVLAPIKIGLLSTVPGAIVVAISWVLLRYGVLWYVGTAGQYQLYGVLGGIIVLLTWVYALCLVFLLGAALNRTLAQDSLSLVGAADRRRPYIFARSEHRSGMDVLPYNPDKEAEPVDRVHLQQLAAGEEMSVQSFRIEPGATVPEHSHHHEQTGYIIEGTLTFVVDGEDVVVGPGDSYAIPGAEPHGAENRGDKEVFGLDIFSPPRTDPDWAE